MLMRPGPSNYDAQARARAPMLNIFLGKYRNYTFSAHLFGGGRCRRASAARRNYDMPFSERCVAHHGVPKCGGGVVASAASRHAA